VKLRSVLKFILTYHMLEVDNMEWYGRV